MSNTPVSELEGEELDLAAMRAFVASKGVTP